MVVIPMTTQRTFTLHMPSALLQSRLHAYLSAYDAACARFPGLALAFTLVLTDPRRDGDWLTRYHAPYFDARWAMEALREFIRQDLYEYETGQPGRCVWTRPLESFDDVLTRARVIAANL